ncbi:MAG: hypothetical protein K6A35_03900 [bacterium]|nr:hypothetical protein [bacterium]
MNIVKNNRVNKGVALVFALMAIIVLFSIATTVTAVSMNHGKSTRTVSYNDFALQAANWGIEAAIEYMGQKGDGRSSDTSQWKSDGHGGYCLTEDGTSGYGKINSLSGVKVSITSVDSDTLKNDYGLNYCEGTPLGADQWHSGDSKKIVFVNSGGTGRYVLSGGGEKNNVTVEVICTEYRNAAKQRPSSYELLSVARVSSPSASGVSIANGPDAKGVLSTRVVCAMVRQEQVSDFMHFVQNARTFDAVDTALADDNKLREGLQAVVYLPQDYKESGRLRVDGYGDDDPENNRLKKVLHTAGVDGTLGFFGDEDANNAANNYHLTGDVTTNRGTDTYVYKKSGANGSASQWSKYTDAFQGALHANVDPLGLPDSTGYHEKLKNNNSIIRFQVAGAKLSSDDYNNGFGCSDYQGIRDKAAVDAITGKCPDIAQRATGGEKDVGTAPVFATVRVEICSQKDGDDTKGKVRIVKYNSTMTEDSDPGGIDKNYVEPLRASVNGTVLGDTNGVYDISNIPEGTIYVDGGNVEVVNVKKFATSGISTDYVVDKNGNGINDPESGNDHNGDDVNHGLMGGLTIASNVNATREAVRASVGADGYKGTASDLSSNTDDVAGLYSDYARYFWNSEYNKNVAGNLQPPYSNAQLHDVYKTLNDKAKEMVVKTQHWDSNAEKWVNDPPVERGEKDLETSFITGTPAPSGSQDIYDKVLKDNYSADSLAYDTGKKYWPTMSSSGVENEGNTFVGSDLTYGGEPTSALGIVAKKSILLNDRTNPSKKQLSIHGLFMCIDHSLQFDWRNKAGNPLYANLYSEDKSRSIILNGAIVGGFLDAEGDTFGRGYYKQSFKYDDNLLLNPPPNVPQWDITEESLKNFVILSYEDRGAINITETD